MQVVQLTLIKVSSLKVCPSLLTPEIVEAHPGEKRFSTFVAVSTLVATAVAAAAPKEGSPKNGHNDDDHKCDLTRAVVSLPLSLLELLCLIFLGLSRVGMAAHARQWPLLSIDDTVSRCTANLANIDAQESVKHIPSPSGIVEGHHMTRVVEDNISQVARFLVGASWFAFEGPVLLRGNNALRNLKTLTAIPGHLVDHSLSPDVVADHVLVAGEEGDGHLGQ